MGIGIGTAMYAANTIVGLIGNKQNQKKQIATNEANRRINKLQNSIVTETNVKNQLKEFQEFSENQKRLSSSQNVELYSGGMSTKSSVFSGVKHEQTADYYEGVQNLRENVKKINNDKKIMDLQADISYNNANEEAKQKYNNFDLLINNATKYKQYYDTAKDTSDVDNLLKNAVGKINSASSVFGVKSKLGG
ncbi:MAG: hypothetical protein ACRC6E_10470 [Fusobacteriaceae bacterium]